MIRLLQTILFILLLGTLNAQKDPVIQVEHVNPYFSEYLLRVENDTYYDIEFKEKNHTGLVLFYDNVFNPYLINASINGTRLIQDPHIWQRGYYSEHTQLFVFSRGTNKIRLYSGKMIGVISLHCYDAGKSPEISGNRNVISQIDSCREPQSIPPSVWRSGLPVPLLPPETNSVQHVVVHHSAGSNTDTNYTDVVRNIYLLHTQTNGWNDVGYNFLISQDGAIFQGRDDQGMMEKDNVKGAHFCGKNTGTMGICLLGNYMDAEPTSFTIHSLSELLAWKLHKENLPPYGSGVHPQGSGNLLSNIAGHRDGCSTLCPGDSTYLVMNNVRDSVDALMQNCTPITPPVSVSSNINIADELRMYNAENKLVITGVNEELTLQLFNSIGQQYEAIHISSNSTIDLQYYPKGLMIATLRKGSVMYKQKILVY